MRYIVGNFTITILLNVLILYCIWSIVELHWSLDILLVIVVYTFVGYFVERKLSAYINKFADLFFKDKNV